MISQEFYFGKFRSLISEPARPSEHLYWRIDKMISWIHSRPKAWLSMKFQLSYPVRTCSCLAPCLRFHFLPLHRKMHWVIRDAHNRCAHFQWSCPFSLSYYCRCFRWTGFNLLYVIIHCDGTLSPPYVPTVWRSWFVTASSWQLTFSLFFSILHVFL